MVSGLAGRSLRHLVLAAQLNEIAASQQPPTLPTLVSAFLPRSTCEAGKEKTQLWQG